MHAYPTRVGAVLLLVCLSIVDSAVGENLYALLGISTSARDLTDRDLKRAFRRKALAVHPDKIDTHDSSNAEAFSALKDAYDMLRGRERAEDTTETLYIPLPLLMRGNHIVVKRERSQSSICKVCLGTGAPPGFPTPSVCATCGGTGTATVRLGCGPGQPCIHFTGRCADCGGAGIRGRACQQCKGAGITRSQQTFNVRIPPAAVEGLELRLVGEGDVTSKSERPGDLVVKIQSANHDFFQRSKESNLDLVTFASASINQLRSGFTLDLPSLEGDKIIPIEVPGDPSMVDGQLRMLTVSDFTPVGGKLHVEISQR